MNCRRASFRLAMLFGALVLLPMALAQTARHDVAVAIPETIGIRMVGAGGGARAVKFDYATDVGSYRSAANGGVALGPTSVSSFDDIEVRVNGNGRWSVNVEATPLVYSGTGTGGGLELSDLRVDRGSVSGLSQEAITVGRILLWIYGRYDTSWTLSTTPRQIATTWFGTNGWESLGFNGWDYTLAVNGDEEAGTYLTTVTYFLTSP
ncbi:MAG: hypothetical protein LC667_17525 [Thioalkalivibrio sp.]|nr:hypothetical protein [Thioalkalivibrio sp.]